MHCILIIAFYSLMCIASVLLDNGVCKFAVSILSKTRRVLYKHENYLLLGVQLLNLALFQMICVNCLPIYHDGTDHTLWYGLIITSCILVSRDIAYLLNINYSSI